MTQDGQQAGLLPVLFLVSAIGTALPRNLTEFIIFRVIGGIGVGAASMTSPMYIAEISPARIRGRMVSVNQFAIIFGMLVVYFVNYFIARSGTEQWNIQYGWRWMFGSEAVPAILLLILLFLVPESPRWLTKQGRTEEALRILSRVRDSERAQVELAEIKDAIAHESGSIAQLFQPRMRIVLLIGVGLAILQQVTGINVFLYYAPEIFKELGTGTNAALLQTVIVGAVNLAFTIVAIWTVDLLGRKPLMILGVAGMGVSLFAMGLAAYLQRTELWVLVFILAYIASFALSVGPVTWVILSEIFPTSIRGRAMSIATFWLWSANYVVSQTFPMMNKNKWLVDRFHHGFPFWVYGTLCAVELIFVLFMLPETKGKTLEQIEKHWIKWEK
ncbi:MAG: sugar porter family MFS transporter [Planctomycetota bacterium]